MFLTVNKIILFVFLFSEHMLGRLKRMEDIDGLPKYVDIFDSKTLKDDIFKCYLECSYKYFFNRIIYIKFME